MRRPSVEPPARSLELIGAGPNQWTAAEGALKVRETAYVAASGMGVEQYLHGPSVAVGPSDSLVCLDGGGPGSERLLAVARSAESCGVPVRVFTADAPSELLSVFPLTAVVQRIALEPPSVSARTPTASAATCRREPTRWMASICDRVSSTPRRV